MKFDINKLTLWAAFLGTPTEEEIQEQANRMKNGKAYLFKTKDGGLIMRNRRRLNDIEKRNGEVFLRRVLPPQSDKPLLLIITKDICQH